MSFIIMRRVPRSSDDGLWEPTGSAAAGYPTKDTAVAIARKFLMRHPRGTFAVFERVAMVENKTVETITR